MCDELGLKTFLALMDEIRVLALEKQPTCPDYGLNYEIKVCVHQRYTYRALVMN